MTDHQIKILKKCRELQQRIANSRPESWERWKLANWEEQTEHGPEYKISEWFGQMSERDSTHYRRCVLKLENQGFLAIWRRWGDRMTNVKLTAAGEEILRGNQ